MEPNSSTVIAIAAVGKGTRAIGRSQGKPLLWHIPEDLKRFKDLTSGHPVIMGRTTFLSLPEKFRPLPDRTNIVVSRNAKVLHFPRVHMAKSPEEAIEYAKSAPGGDKIYIMGGGQLYRYALEHNLVDVLEITEVDDATSGDVFFPDYSSFTKVLGKDAHPEHDPPFTFLTLKRQ